MNLLASRTDSATQEPFMAAFGALQSGDVSGFQALLRANPSLAGERGTNGNTLLNLAVSFASRPEWKGGTSTVDALLEAGSDVNDPNDRGWTPLHAAAYSNKPEIAALLIAKGAALDAEAHGAGGTPLIAALFWGHREVADLLGRHSLAPGNLRAAAGLGIPELVEACFSGERTLTAEAGAARGFYRPHSGFPDWQPSTDPQEVLDEALVWACKSNRVAVLERLVRAGARLDADPYRGTALIWAAACNRLEAASWLLDHGASVNQKATFGGLTHGQGITALHITAQNGHLPMVKLLVERGADLSIQDDLYHATPEARRCILRTDGGARLSALGPLTHIPNDLSDDTSYRSKPKYASCARSLSQPALNMVWFPSPWPQLQHPISFNSRRSAGIESSSPTPAICGPWPAPAAKPHA